MQDTQAVASISLEREFFGGKERRVLEFADLTASLFRYDTGVEAIRLGNARGHVLVLPFMGQMVWDAVFDGVRLAMDSMFDMPRPATTIVETYGALAYHAGLLRNGVPSAEDTHRLHGEMPCARMTTAGLSCGTDAQGLFVAVTGLYDHAMGFGAHYRASPRVVLRPGTTFDIEMNVENLSAKPMDLMYICHVNFAFVEGGRVLQPVPFTPDHVVTRTAIPSFVEPTEDYRVMLRELAADPGRMRVLSEPHRYDPEQVFYIRGLAAGPDGLVHLGMLRPEGDGFTIAYDPAAMPRAIRWILDNGDQRVAAFAMPGTCEPEGFLAEKRKGLVRVLDSGARASFTTHLGYVDQAGAAHLLRRIEPNA